MWSNIESEAKQFAQSYAALFSSPHASSSEHVAQVAADVSKYYRPGLTVFTNGQILRFESQAEAAGLIEQEMRNNIESGLGTCLILQQTTATMYSKSAATVRLTWTFRPKAGSKFDGKTWTFVNIYGYRAASDGQAAGWEYVVRDNEVNEMKAVTGKAFNE